VSLRSAGGGYGDSDPLSDAFYPLYKRLFGEDSDFVDSLENKLAEARMPQTVEIYLSRALALGVIVGAVLTLLGIVTGWALFTFVVTDLPVLLGFPGISDSTVALLQAVKVPAFIVLSGIVFGSIGFGTGFGSMVARPYLRCFASGTCGRGRVSRRSSRTTSGSSPVRTTPG
jgi:flagellar protein FlaJ